MDEHMILAELGLRVDEDANVLPCLHTASYAEGSRPFTHLRERHQSTSRLRKGSQNYYQDEIFISLAQRGGTGRRRADGLE